MSWVSGRGSGTVALAVWDGVNAADVDVNVPNQPGLVAVGIHFQGLRIDPSSPGQPFGLTTGVRASVGVANP